MEVLTEKLELAKKNEPHSQSVIIDSSKVSFKDRSLLRQKSEIHSSLSKKKHISFSTPHQPKSFSKSSTFSLSHSKSGLLTPPTRLSIGNSQEINFNDRSLLKLNEKFIKITEELETARETGRFTARETGGHTERESANYNENFSMNAMKANDIIDDADFKGFPILKWCAFCRKEAMTEVVYKNTSKTFWSSLGILLSGGVLGCFLIPYASTACKKAIIQCHICKHEL